MEYLNFDIKVGRQASNGIYPVQVVYSPAGETDGEMRFPFDEETLESHLQDLQYTLVRAPFRSLSDEVQAVQDFGKQLFAALFTGDVRSLYYKSLQEAGQHSKQQEETGLRLRLRIQAPELAVVPWEYLYDELRNVYICLSNTTPLVRYVEQSKVIPPLLVTPPLRILGMVASPSDQLLLEVDKEKAHVEEALERLRAKKLVELDWVEGQRWQDLQEAMWRGPWHIFHFIGHGGFYQGEGVLALTGEHGQTDPVGATELGLLLADHSSLRLALLNACEGAMGSERDLFSSTAATLAKRNIPAVLAMQYKITDKAANQFAFTFYRALAAGMPVDEAVAEARKALSKLVHKNSLEWGTPVLYLRSRESRLFTLPSQEPPPLEAAPPSSSSDFLPTLRVMSIAQKFSQEKYQVQGKDITIGRAEGNDLVLFDPAVSRQHARLFWNGEWRVRRLDGAGILYVNGEQRNEAKLLLGDQLVIGGSIVRFEDPQWNSRIDLGSHDDPLLLPPEPIPHLTVYWRGGRFVVPLRDRTITIGRAPENGIVIPSLVISAHHALLSKTSDGGYRIQDDGSRHGLFLQGKPIKDHLLRHQDKIVVGSREQGQFVVLAYARPPSQESRKADTVEY